MPRFVWAWLMSDALMSSVVEWWPRYRDWVLSQPRLLFKEQSFAIISGKGHAQRQAFMVQWKASQGALAHAEHDDHNTIEHICRWHGRQEVWGAITEVAQSRYTFGFVTWWGHPTTLSPTHLLWILAWIAWDIHVRLHFAIGIQWM